MSKSKKVSIKSLNSFSKKTDHAIVDKFADEYVGISSSKEHTLNHIAHIDREGEETSRKSTQLQLIDETRFTLVIPSYLHTRIKKHCAINSVSMKAILTDILIKEFPER